MAASILTVDDERQVRNLLSRILSGVGYDCVEAEDAREAKIVLAQQTCELMLCDIEMPGESGLELIRFVRDAYPDIGIVMVTVIDDSAVAREVIDIGVYGYVVKPFQKNQVLITVANAARRRELEIRERARRRDLELMVREKTAELLQMQDHMDRRERELALKDVEHRQLQTTLDVLLQKRDADRASIEEQVLETIHKAIFPYIQKLRHIGLNERQTALVDILEANLKEAVSPFVKVLSSSYLRLTPSELQVADLVRQGRQTKEIADILGLSVNTIMTHRYQIRSKLGLLGKSTNLKTYLLSLR